jgi:hypothetical protein
VSQSASGSSTLNGSNLGYQMLKQSGWQEGNGLGSAGAGIIEPIVARFVVVGCVDMCRFRMNIDLSLCVL